MNQPSPASPVLVLLAAGRATRYGSLKQVEPVGPGGLALMDYAMFDARRAGFGEMVVVVSPETQATVASHLQRVWGVGDRATWVVQETPRGTADAVLTAREAVSGRPFAVANADDYYGPRAYEAIVDALGGRTIPEGSWCLAGYRLADTLSPNGGVNRGICSTDAAGALESLVEGLGLVRVGAGGVAGENPQGAKLVLTGEESASTNLWGFAPNIWPFLEQASKVFLESDESTSGGEFRLTDVVSEAVRTGFARVAVLPVPAEYLGLTFEDDREGVVERLAQRGPLDTSVARSRSGVLNSHRSSES